MTDGLSLSLQDAPSLQDNIPSVDLGSFESWIEIQPMTTITGLLDAIALELYRRRMYTYGNEIKQIVIELRT